MKLRYILLSMIVICGLLINISEGQDITNGASFLKIGAGARAISLGGAFVAVADDASAGYWNPAGLTQIQGPVIYLADRITVIDTDYANLAIASPIWKLGYFGISTIYYSCGDVPTYDSQGMSTGSLTDREAAMILSYAYKLNQLSLGANAKYVYQDMADDYTSTVSDGMGADVAVMYEIFKSLTVGAAFHGQYEITSSDDGSLSGESPLNIRAGVHYMADMGKENSFNLMMDFDQTRSRPLKLHIGTEFILYDILSMRAGLDDLYVESRDSGISNLDMIRENLKPTFGLGLKWKMGKAGTSPNAKQSTLIFDYALSIERLGVRNFFALAYQF